MHQPTRADILAYSGLRFAEILICALPLPLARMLGRGLGKLLFAFGKSRREAAIANATRCFPEWDETKVHAMIRENFAQLGMVGVEFLSVSKISAEKIRRMVKLENEELLQEAQAQGKGVFLLGAHLGNWEYAGLSLRAYGYPCDAIGRRIKNPLVDKRINQLRSKFGTHMIPHRNAVKPVFKALRGGSIIGFLMDQRALPRDGILSTFFAQPVSTNRGLAMLALKSGAPVVMVETTRVDGGFKVYFSSIVAPPKTDDREEAIALFTQEFDNRIEEAVRRNPEQWFWMHRRWEVPPEMAQ